MGSVQDDLFADYMRHLNSFGPGDAPYSSPQSATVPLSSGQGGVLGACKTATSGDMVNMSPPGACQLTCSSRGS